VPSKPKPVLPLVPVFPLPNVHLCPGALLPLHVFEPRYRSLAAAAIAGEKRIVMALLRPGWEDDYLGRPPIFPVAGLGEIVRSQRLPDGRFNLILRGLGRVLVVREQPGKPYRLAEVRPLEEKEGPADEGLRRKLLAAVRGLGGPALEGPCGAALGALADLALLRLPVEACRRQSIFEILDCRDRAGAVIRAAEETVRTRELLRGEMHRDDPRRN
jgi:Lon protease-like protein